MKNHQVVAYDVALSFAGEDRAFVEKVAQYLREQNVEVFYDLFEEIKLWGRDLTEELDEIYRRRAKYVVMFISDAYARKVWTNHERRSALAAAIEEKREYILPARFDSTDLPGLRPTIRYLDLRRESPESFGAKIVAKVQLGKIETSEQPDVQQRTRSLPTPHQIYCITRIDSDRLGQQLEHHYSKYGHAVIIPVEGYNRDDEVLVVELYRNAESPFPTIEIDAYEWAMDLIAPEAAHFFGPGAIVYICGPWDMHQFLYERRSIDILSFDTQTARDSFESVVEIDRQLMTKTADWWKYEGFRLLTYRLLVLGEESFLLSKFQGQSVPAEDRLLWGLQHAMLHWYMAGLNVGDYAANHYHHAEQLSYNELSKSKKLNLGLTQRKRLAALKRLAQASGSEFARAAINAIQGDVG